MSEEKMVTSATTPSPASEVIRGKIIESEIKVTVDPTRPLPLACALYAIETPGGVWLCAYYGTNRSVFDFLPQKGAEVDESKLGVVFHKKRFLPKDQYQTAAWDQFKKSQLMT
jgi:hypothetical protein